MGHLKGWEWRQSRRAVEKKERSKLGGSDKDTNAKREVMLRPIPKVENQNKAIVVSESKGKVIVLMGNKAVRINTSGKTEIVPGDHVSVEEKNGKYVITGIQERTSTFSKSKVDSTRVNGIERKQAIAANIDVGVIVVSSKDPPLHPKLIDRYLILMQKNGIKPIICMNKLDLAGEEERRMLEHYRKLGIEVRETSTVTNEGINDLKSVLHNKKAVFVGHSGVGKSSLINAITEEQGVKVGDVSEKTGKGKHTTTASTLYKWNENSHIIDTPGIRTLTLSDVKREDLQNHFVEFREPKQNCKYENCLHHDEEEKDCGVKQAVSKGKIPEKRYESYVKILEELETNIPRRKRV